MSGRTYKIGEAAQLLNLKSYVLRFWETEFPQLTPIRTEKGQRLYSESDLELLKFIRHLLHERGLTIEGARKVLQSRNENGDMGLSSELLDEGYKDFGGEGVIPDSFETPAGEGDEHEDFSAYAHLTAQAVSQKLTLEYALGELRDIQAMLQNPKLSD